MIVTTELDLGSGYVFYPAISSENDSAFMIQSYPVENTMMMGFDKLMGRPEPEKEDSDAV